MEDNDMHQERIEYKLKRRKEEIKNILIGKRLQPDHRKVQRSITDFIVREEQIKVEEKEDLGVKGYPNASKYHKKRKKKDKKRCWICKSPYHLKRLCPYIRMFSLW